MRSERIREILCRYFISGVKCGLVVSIATILMVEWLGSNTVS
jgi:hypothetical protein